MRSVLAALLISNAFQSAFAQVEPLNQMKVVHLNNGANAVDLDADKRADLIVVAWRENNNAHSYDIFTFYVNNPSSREHPLNLVVVADSVGHGFSEAVRTELGAECVLTDLRVLQPRVGPDFLVIARRDFGDSYSDSLPVTFTVYMLAMYDEGVPGVPPFQFVPMRTIRSNGKYCDVEHAFLTELGLGAYR